MLARKILNKIESENNPYENISQRKSSDNEGSLSGDADFETYTI